jgi:hypothetical protein
VRPASQTQNVERFVETSFVLEKVGVGGETEPQGRRGSRLGRNRIGDAPKVRGLWCFGRKIGEVPANCRNLPGEPLAGFDPLDTGQQPVYQACHHVRAEGEPGRALAAVLAFDPGPLQEGSMRQDIRRRPELFEELLGREQRWILPP